MSKARGVRGKKGTAHSKKAARSRLPKWVLWSVSAAILVAALGVGAAVVGKSGRSSLTASTAPAAVAGGSAATASDGAVRVPNFNMVVYQGKGALGGRRLDFASLFAGNHHEPVVLNFWAGGCPPCRAEMPGFERVYKAVGRRVLFLGVDIGPYTGLGTHAQARNLLGRLRITYPAAYATNDPTQMYGITGIPTTILFKPDGTPFYERVGFFPEQELRSKIEDLIAASK